MGKTVTIHLCKKDYDFILWSLSTDARLLKEYGEYLEKDQSEAINEYLRVINNFKNQQIINNK